MSYILTEMLQQMMLALLSIICKICDRLCFYFYDFYFCIIISKTRNKKLQQTRKARISEMKNT